ncbi:MAG: hypothetical protein KKD18_03915 [Nanoarchaeota archaeon]|nr:hypothetical protein [Nanoarchaeota archaeon]
MNKKGMELAITTLILILLGVVILIAVIFALTGGFKRFSGTTDPFTDSAEATAIKQNGLSACQDQSRMIYCCEEYEIDNKPVNCTDTRLELGCTLDCSNFEC